LKITDPDPGGLLLSVGNPSKFILWYWTKVGGNLVSGYMDRYLNRGLGVINRIKLVYRNPVGRERPIIDAVFFNPLSFF
jgi:hypothetical protein